MDTDVAIESESITPFGDIVYVMDQFNKILCRNQSHYEIIHLQRKA